MSRLGFALPGAAALALCALASTSVFAQQGGAGTAPGTTTPQASPEPATSAPPRREDDGGREGADRDRGDRDYSDRDRGDRRDWSGRDRRDFDHQGSDDERWRRWRREGPMRRGERDGDDYGRRRDDGWRRDGWREPDRRRDEDGPRSHAMGPGRGGAMMGPRMMRRLCGAGGERMLGAMLDRLERVTQPTDAQRPAFEKLKDAAAKARETVKAACPDGPRPVTPPGRLAAAEKRLEALLAAVRLVRAPLDEYYGSLSEEQKARLYMSRGRGGRDGFDRRRRERDGERRPPDNDRRGWRGQDREHRREGFNRREDERRFERPGTRHDQDRDGWPDDWRGRS
jgi:hypothetical protein